MKNTIPDSYKQGIHRIEQHTTDTMCAWLEGELRGINHILAGSRDDYPVQAIVNHHPYLSLETQKRMADAIERIILEWKASPSDWPESATRALLSLAADLRISAVLPLLQSLARDKKAFARIEPLQPEALRTIATLSTNNERGYWSEIAQQHPDFAGMAFQVLARIAPSDALTLLAHLPKNQATIGGVARKLPGFVSQFPVEERAQVLKAIADALVSLPDKFSNPLRGALVEAGFELPLVSGISTWIHANVHSAITRLGYVLHPMSNVLGSHLADRKFA